MKIGTFWCWLWGHKFAHKVSRTGIDFEGNISPGKIWWKFQRENYCIRCGITREELTAENFFNQYNEELEDKIKGKRKKWEGTNHNYFGYNEVLDDVLALLKDNSRE